MTFFHLLGQFMEFDEDNSGDIGEVYTFSYLKLLSQMTLFRNQGRLFCKGM